MVARALVALIGALMVVCLFLLIRAGISYLPIGGNKDGKTKPTESPSKKPEVIIPEGYEKIYKQLKPLLED